ncbi:MAG: hypothetical protein WAU42_14765 [Solirubrobacteraceae bacterium]
MPATDYKPSIDEIGARIKARTLETVSGKRAGTFNANTSPTAEEVGTFIDDALSEVGARVGQDLDQEYWAAAKYAAVMHVCSSIELSLYPDSTDEAASAYSAFKQRFDNAIEALNTAIKEIEPNERRVVSLRQGSLVRWGGFGRLDPFFNELLP